MMALSAAVLLACGLVAVVSDRAETALAAAAHPRWSRSRGDAAKIAYNSRPSVTFDQDMDTSALLWHLYIYAETGFALQPLTYDSATKTATHPHRQLVAGKTYYVTRPRRDKYGGSQRGRLTHLVVLYRSPSPLVVTKAFFDGSVNCPLNQVISSPLTRTWTLQVHPILILLRKHSGRVLTAISYTRQAWRPNDNPLEEATTYDVTLIGTATGMNGMCAGSAVVEFRSLPRPVGRHEFPADSAKTRSWTWSHSHLRP
jgi:hypothetical protein